MVKSLSTKRSNNLNYSYCRHRSHHWFLNINLSLIIINLCLLKICSSKNENHLNCFWNRNCASNDLWLPNDGLRQVPSSLQSLNGFFSIGFLVRLDWKLLYFYWIMTKWPNLRQKTKTLRNLPEFEFHFR